MLGQIVHLLAHQVRDVSKFVLFGAETEKSKNKDVSLGLFYYTKNDVSDESP